MTNAALIAEAKRLDAKYGGHWQIEYEHGAALPSVVCNAEWPHAGKIIISRHVEPELADFIRSLPERVLQLADALVNMRAEFAATLRVVRQGLDPADPTYKIATEAIERLETPDCPARPMEPGT